MTEVIELEDNMPEEHNILELLDELVPRLTNRVQAYHTMFSLPLIAEQWEETLHRSFNDI